MSDSKDPKDPKNSNDADATRLLNPATDTLKIDLELAKATDPVLILIRGTPQGKKYSLKGATKFLLGRDKSVEIQLDDANISRQHAQITAEDGKIYIEDLGSRNGTFLNDEPLGTSRKELEKEDMIKLGSTILKYLPAGQLETLYHINLTNAASMDKLTGLYNRKYISEVLEVEFKRAKALHSQISVVLFDIDNFKKINDTYGHDCGDYVLTTLGTQVKASGLRERDLAGRYGGEEFIVVLTNSAADQAADVAERIRKRIEGHEFTYDNQKISVTVSLGVASIRKDFHLGADIYKEADKALYESKRNGKNKVTVAGDKP
ncbi:MAG TPA: GGDEF domain-containing protein [Bdellovibrionota bacterium]|jgi:diguanylate cyclase (GGDEF)-like protein